MCRWYETLWRWCDRYINRLWMIRLRALEMGHRIYAKQLFNWMENRPICNDIKGWSFGWYVSTFVARFNRPIMLKPLTCGDRVISVGLGQYHSCWCPGSLRRQDTSSYDIDYVEWVGLCLVWVWILTTCVRSMWRNDIKCKYMFYVPSEKFSMLRVKAQVNGWKQAHG